MLASLFYPNFSIEIHPAGGHLASRLIHWYNPPQGVAERLADEEVSKLGHDFSAQDQNKSDN